MVNGFHALTARGGPVVEATWLSRLLGGCAAKGRMYGKTERVAGGVGIDLERASCLQSHGGDARGHGDPLPAPCLGTVVREMDLLGTQAMHSAGLEWENSAGTRTGPMRAWCRGWDRKTQGATLNQSERRRSHWYHPRVRRMGMRGASGRAPSPAMGDGKAVASRATLVGWQKIGGAGLLAAIVAGMG